MLQQLNDTYDFAEVPYTPSFGRLAVRELKQTMVVEVAFDSIALSSRHKSGIAMRFPRFAQIRWDKPADEADTLETLKTWL